MDIFEYNVDESLRPSIERKLTGTTKIDAQISALPLPKGPIGIKILIKLLRFYRKIAPKSVRCRCVFDPSCSHYSELAFRQHGLLNGIIFTYKRLVKCRPGEGGIDFLHLRQGD